LTADPLVQKAVNPEPAKAVPEVSAEANEQQGFCFICKGIIQVFRNRVHHNVSDKFSQAGALRSCGFADTVLAVLAGAVIHTDRIPKT
jgi:hypothetical protein